MPCFASKFSPPSEEDYEVYKSHGYLGTYEQYLAIKEKTYDPNAILFICGSMEGVEYCAHKECLGFNEFLCDYPIGEERTCDYGMCVDHSNQVGEDLHYCKAHYEIWLEQKPKELHVEEEPLGYMVDNVFYPLEKEWVAKNKSKFLNKPMIRVYSEKLG